MRSLARLWSDEPAELPAPPPRQCIPHDRANLCAECGGIYLAEGALPCPGCGSAVAQSLGRVLNRESGAPSNLRDLADERRLSLVGTGRAS